MSVDASLLGDQPKPAMAVAPCVAVMGVSGCGKSAVASLLSQSLGWPFYEGDAYHPQSNIEKMRAGIPLSDADRLPWLQHLAIIIAHHCASRRPAVLSCSALKPSYRQLLRGAAPLAQRPSYGGGRPRGQTQGEGQCRGQTGQTQGEGQCRGQHQAQSRGQIQGQPGVHSHGQHQGRNPRQLQGAGGSGEAGEGGAALQDWEEGEEGCPIPGVAFILLDPSRRQLQRWVQERAEAGGHFMPPSLLDSQLGTLQYSEEGELYCRITGEPFPSPPAIVQQLVAAFAQGGMGRWAEGECAGGGVEGRAGTSKEGGLTHNDKGGGGSDGGRKGGISQP